jgi:hypothetical protein
MPAKRPVPDPESIPRYTLGRADASRPYRDLCSTCNHAKVCGGRSTPERPIFFCEEFEAFVPLPAAELAIAVPTQPAKRQSAGERAGLCMNCDNAETCSSPKPEGGVWHCEEYR